MRISDWSSDVCSSDLRSLMARAADEHAPANGDRFRADAQHGAHRGKARVGCDQQIAVQRCPTVELDRNSVPLGARCADFAATQQGNVVLSFHCREQRAVDQVVRDAPAQWRAAESRVGREWVRTGRSGWEPDKLQNQKQTNTKKE